MGDAEVEMVVLLRSRGSTIAHLVAMDTIWETILTQEPFNSGKVLKVTNITSMLNSMDIDVSIHKSVSKMLYVCLRMYTKDEAAHKVKANGSDLAFESYRFIVHRGKNASTAHKMIMRNKVMHPESASKIDEIEKRLSEWKQNLRYLAEVCPESQLDDDQLKTILVSIAPEQVAAIRVF